MTLADLKLIPGNCFDLECRIRHPKRRIASNGSHYLAFIIEDWQCTLKAYAWPEQCDIPAQVSDLDKVALGGKLRVFDGQPLASIQYIKPSVTSESSPIDLIPHSLCPEPMLLQKLRNLVCKIKNEALRQFLNSVFSDDEFALLFVRLPASRNHHHSEVGGLLQHSLECAEMVQNFGAVSQDMQDLAVVAALLHDAGKVVTLQNGKFSLERVLLSHDALTLEVLAPHLKQLDHFNRDVSTALRYLWTWRHHRQGAVHPALTIAEAVAAADRMSSGLYAEEKVFNNSPDWQTVARLEPHGNMFWRPRLGLVQH